MEAGSTTGTSNLAAFDTQSAATQWAAQGIAPGTYFVRVRARNTCGGSLIAQAQRPSPLDAVIRRRARAGAIDSAQ